ncbi:phosphoglycerate mutase [Corynebacterium phocae]|uniref:Phosphoglycerate mutase n=1 Tax=Corynebacterium phocae TaxID=161895 RepID=A0A1L7D5P6_9CORY|nr:histidine phosphatase family protein [Corynebacterium phocae]APT93435.1 phosphoglycerate mutase [Corynebacterium phocae]KAA8721129.1 histidine phosphatase family protein [Corynebacterium phocae]
MRIYLVRHGNTYSNVNHIMDTLPPGAELTDTGRQQATDVGYELADLIEGTPRVLSSVAIRAQQTAMAAMRSFEKARDMQPHSIRIEPVMGVQEVFAGDYEMDGSEEVRREYTNALHGWLYGDKQARMKGGETCEDVLARYQPVLEEAVAAGEGPLVVFSHGAAIRVVTRWACNVDPDFAYSGYISNCSFTVMETGGKPFGEWTLERWADFELE